MHPARGRPFEATGIIVTEEAMGWEPSARRAQGSVYEGIVAAWLESLGWVIEARNVTYRCGELDIVARDGPVRVFVEVRSGKDRSVRPEDTVTRRKRERLVRAALLYAMREQRRCAEERRRVMRFDVIAVSSEGGEVLRHHRGAFDADPRRG